MKNFFKKINVSNQCRKSGLSIWQCPQFLFLVMGVVIIATVCISYLIGTRYISDPPIVALLDIVLAAILFTISFIITNSFEGLAEASRMKSEFINIVSHNLRSPITNIKWVAEFLTSDNMEISSEKKEEYFNHLKENISRMVELVDELLIVARIEEGSLPIRKKEFSLEDLVKDLTDGSKTYAEASNVELKFNLEKNIPTAYFDPVLVKLAVENLLDNAIRYTKKGGAVEISIKKKDNYLRFEIKDQGVGIPDKDQQFIFQKFFRSENALRRQTQGSGLGLYISKMIIDKSGGKIWFESKENKGTTFYFIIPIK